LIVNFSTRFHFGFCYVLTVDFSNCQVASFFGLAIKVSKDRIAYVLPDSILLKDFEKTRYLIKEYISEINWLENSGMPDDLKPFADVDHDVCVISTQNKHIQLLRYILSTFDRSTRVIKQHQYVQDKRKIVRKEFNYAFNLIAREKDLEILEKINQFDEMNSFLQCHEGIHTGNSRELLFVRGQNNDTTYPLFYGGGAGDIIENYHSRTSGWFVDYRDKLIDKSKGYYASLRDKRIFCLPKIYITRTGNPFKAFIDLDSNFASNNFFSLQFKDYSENTSENLKIILPFIISNLAQYYIRTFAAPRLGSTFVETKIVHLLKFRIPLQKIACARNDIKAKVDEILLIKQKNPNTSTSLIEADLDQIIFELYGLNEEEISIVKSKGLTA
ncbi:hypothetical protein, partial [Levilinea saccharolytica]|uniref:hypothetical protein n=1 Tax=Levilinea saccharolytica TaxID=229921 RepID=UPI001F44ECC2